MNRHIVHLLTLFGGAMCVALLLLPVMCYTGWTIWSYLIMIAGGTLYGLVAMRMLMRQKKN